MSQYNVHLLNLFILTECSVALCIYQVSDLLQPPAPKLVNVNVVDEMAKVVPGDVNVPASAKLPRKVVVESNSEDSAITINVTRGDKLVTITM